MNFEDNSNTEIRHTIKLYKCRYLEDQKNCHGDVNYFKIYSDSIYKVNGCSLDFENNKCREKFTITINSFKEKFSKHI